MKILFYLAKRYIRLDSHTVLPIVSITVGIAFLIAVISVINGFDLELIKNLTSVGPDILIKGQFNSDSLKVLKGYKAFLYDKEDGVIFNPKNSVYSGVQVNTFNQRYLKEFYHTNANFVIGDALSKKIQAGELSTLYLYIPEGNKISDISADVYQVGDVFKTGIYQYDLLNVVVAKKLKYSPYIFIKLKNPMDAVKEKSKILKLFPFSQVYTWMDMNDNIIKSLKLESIVVFLIILFTLLLSGFTISNSLLQRVYERRKDMGILFSLGFSKKSFMYLILIEAFIMWCIGSVFGVFGGLFINFVISFLRIHLPSNIYYITKVPVVFNGLKTLFIVGFSLIITLVSSVFPAIKAFKEDPIELIRFE